MDKRAAKLDYKLSRRPMGIFQIRNVQTDKVFVGSTPNLDAVFNRHKFQLNAGGHPSKSLQQDWNELGEEKFAFEVLEELPERDNPNYDYSSDLETLEDLWLEKLEPYGEKGYNERKKTREERLRMIAAKRQQ